MPKNLFAGIPEYVRITIYAQVKYLIHTPYFSRDDADDIIQDLLLFYLDTFYRQKIPNEAYVVASLQYKAKKLIRTKVRKRFSLFVSLEDLDDCPDVLKTSGHFNKSDIKLLIREVTNNLSDKEKKIFAMILSGATTKDIAKINHISKSTIYKVLEKVKNFIK